MENTVFDLMNAQQRHTIMFASPVIQIRSETMEVSNTPLATTLANQYASNEQSTTPYKKPTPDSKRLLSMGAQRVRVAAVDQSPTPINPTQMNVSPLRSKHIVAATPLRGFTNQPTAMNYMKPTEASKYAQEQAISSTPSRVTRKATFSSRTPASTTPKRKSGSRPEPPSSAMKAHNPAPVVQASNKPMKSEHSPHDMVAAHPYTPTRSQSAQRPRATTPPSTKRPHQKTEANTKANSKAKDTRYAQPFNSAEKMNTPRAKEPISRTKKPQDRKGIPFDINQYSPIRPPASHNILLSSPQSLLRRSLSAEDLHVRLIPPEIPSSSASVQSSRRSKSAPKARPTALQLKETKPKEEPVEHIAPITTLVAPTPAPASIPTKKPINSKKTSNKITASVISRNKALKQAMIAKTAGHPNVSTPGFAALTFATYARQKENNNAHHNNPPKIPTTKPLVGHYQAPTTASRTRAISPVYHPSPDNELDTSFIEEPSEYPPVPEPPMKFTRDEIVQVLSECNALLKKQGSDSSPKNTLNNNNIQNYNNQNYTFNEDLHEDTHSTYQDDYFLDSEDTRPCDSEGNNMNSHMMNMNMEDSDIGTFDNLSAVDEISYQPSIDDLNMLDDLMNEVEELQANHHHNNNNMQINNNTTTHNNINNNNQMNHHLQDNSHNLSDDHKNMSSMTSKDPHHYESSDLVNQEDHDSQEQTSDHTGEHSTSPSKSAFSMTNSEPTNGFVENMMDNAMLYNSHDVSKMLRDDSKSYSSMIPSAVPPPLALSTSNLDDLSAVLAPPSASPTTISLQGLNSHGNRPTSPFDPCSPNATKFMGTNFQARRTSFALDPLKLHSSEWNLETSLSTPTYGSSRPPSVKTYPNKRIISVDSIDLSYGPGTPLPSQSPHPMNQSHKTAPFASSLSMIKLKDSMDASSPSANNSVLNKAMILSQEPDLLPSRSHSMSFDCSSENNPPTIQLPSSESNMYYEERNKENFSPIFTAMSEPTSCRTIGKSPRAPLQAIHEESYDFEVSMIEKEVPQMTLSTIEALPEHLLLEEQTLPDFEESVFPQTKSFDLVNMLSPTSSLVASSSQILLQSSNEQQQPLAGLTTSNLGSDQPSDQQLLSLLNHNISDNLSDNLSDEINNYNNNNNNTNSDDLHSSFTIPKQLNESFEYHPRSPIHVTGTPKLHTKSSRSFNEFESDRNTPSRHLPLPGSTRPETPFTPNLHFPIDEMSLPSQSHEMNAFSTAEMIIPMTLKEHSKASMMNIEDSLVSEVTDHTGYHSSYDEIRLFSLQHHNDSSFSVTSQDYNRRSLTYGHQKYRETLNIVSSDNLSSDPVAIQLLLGKATDEKVFIPVRTSQDLKSSLV